MTDEWWYHRDGVTTGPLSLRHVRGMILDKLLSDRDWVWSPGMTDWTQLRRVESFARHLPQSVYPGTDDEAAPPDVALPDPGGWRPAGPWSRLLAQCIDQYLTALIVGFIIGFTGLELSAGYGDKLDEVLLGIALIPISLFLQALLLACIGTTPGKALLRLRLSRTDGTRPGLIRLIDRQSRLWVMGYAVGMPVLSLFTFYFAYKRVGRGQAAVWDAPLGLQVQQPGRQRGRFVAGLIVYGLLLLTIPAGTYLTTYLVETQSQETEEEPAPPNPAQTWENPVTRRTAAVEAGWELEQEKLDSGGTVHWFWSQTDSGAAMIQRDFIQVPFTDFASRYLEEQVKETVTRAPSAPKDGQPACAEGTTPGNAETEPGTTYIIRICGLTSGEIWYLRGRSSNDDEAEQARVRALLDQLEQTLR